jgi:hypothetical protein
MKRLLLAFALLGLMTVTGCSVKVTTPTVPSATPPSAAATTGKVDVKVEKKDDDDHSHERDKMEVAHCGPKIHAWLTAHISSKTGNELDIFFETLDDKPIAMSVEKFTAKVKPSREDKTYDVVFEPAPASERPKDEPKGKCSHFVAKAPWMKADDTLFVQFELEVDGKMRKSTWKSFDVKKNTHHSE